MLDKELIQAVLNKEHSAFTIFYNKIVDHFFSYLKSNFSLSNADIQDIISNTFIKIWNNLDKFDSNKGVFSTWIWTILRNTTKDFFKKRKEYVFTDFEYVNNDGEKVSMEESIEYDDKSMDILENDYKYEQIKNVIGELKTLEKEILFLRYTEGKSLKEVSQIVGISEGNVRVKIHRIMEKLKKKLV